MVGKRRARKPIPKAAKAVEVAGVEGAEFIRDLRDLVDDYRDMGKVPINFRFGGLLGMLLGDDTGMDIKLPPRRPG